MRCRKAASRGSAGWYSRRAERAESKITRLSRTNSRPWQTRSRGDRKRTPFSRRPASAKARHAQRRRRDRRLAAPAPSRRWLLPRDLPRGGAPPAATGTRGAERFHGHLLLAAQPGLLGAARGGFGRSVAPLLRRYAFAALLRRRGGSPGGSAGLTAAGR